MTAASRISYPDKRRRALLKAILQDAYPVSPPRDGAGWPSRKTDVRRAPAKLRRTSPKREAFLYFRNFVFALIALAIITQLL